MLLMKQTQAFISTYTADVSGVCSALYELGGMTIMHDASGCNSTYNTHDEPRWFDSDSLVFVSALTETDAIMGNDEKLIGDILQAAMELKPEFIAIAGSPIPMMTGCDLPAIAREIELRSGIPAFGFSTNGMNSYVKGAGAALAAYAESFVKKADKRKGCVNILGVTPIDFSVNGSVGSMKDFLIENGYEVVSSFAMGSSPEELKNAACAEVNLVVSSVGLAVAEGLYKLFGTPYVIGTPYKGEFAERVLEHLKKATESGERITAFDEFCGESDTFIIGESVMSRSLAAAIALKHGKTPRVVCPLEMHEGILSSGDSAACEEDDIKQTINGAAIVIADPLYKSIVSEKTRFYFLPHEGFSGRIFRKSIPDLIKNGI